MKLYLFTAFLFLSSCGYNWGHYNRSLPGGYKTIYVQQFDNTSKEVGIEGFFTNAMIREFQRSGFTVVTDKNSAELILHGTISSVDYIGSRSRTDFPTTRSGVIFNSSLFTQYRVHVLSNLKVTKSIDNTVVWQTTLQGDKHFQGPQLFESGLRASNPLYGQSVREQTLKLVAKEMMNDAFDQLTENF